MIEGLASLAAYCALMSGTPGPNNVMLATSGANFGYRRTLPYLLGIIAGNFGMTFVACVGLGAMFALFPRIHDVLRVVGAVYLCYLAWKLAGSGAIANAAVSRPLTSWNGAMFQLVNPKSWMKAVTIATVFMPAGLGPVQGSLLVSTIGLLIGFPLISVWTLFGVWIGRFLGTPRKLRIFNAAMGVALLALAISLMA